MAKTIKILLEDGTFNDIVTVEDMSSRGILLMAPREKIDKLFLQKEATFWGVYILVSENQVYVGQASELKKRIKQHNAGSEFWNKAIVMTTIDNSLTKSAIDYIETDLIEKAKRNSNLHPENKKSGNKQKVDRYDKPAFDSYIENTIFLLELLDVFVFSEKKHKQRISVKGRQKDITNNDIKPDSEVSPLSKKTDGSVELYLEEKIKNSGLTVKASCIKLSDGYTVLKGSTINPIVNNKTCSGIAIKAREEAKIQNDTLLEDKLLPSPSAAAMFVVGASRNGYTSWKNASGKTLREIETDKTN